MDSATNRALAGALTSVHRGMAAVFSCSHLTVHIYVWPILFGLFMMYMLSPVLLGLSLLDCESLSLVVVSMVMMLCDFVQRLRWPRNAKPKHEAAVTSRDYHRRSKPVSHVKMPAQECNIRLDPETAELDAALADACEDIFGPTMPTSPKAPTCKIIAIGPGLLEPAPKLSRVLGAIARITADVIPGAKIYGFERTASSPGYSGGSMEVVVVVPCTQLVELLGDRLQRGIRGGHLMLTGVQLYKSALRYLIDHLVSEGFKFKCSAFKAQEPTVALTAPLGYTSGQGVYVSLSVNNPLPFLESILTRQASVSDPRAVPLIATVQRWAEVRGLAHPVFGPLTMYGWVHTCLFFLTQHAQPRMTPLAFNEKCRGSPEHDKCSRPADPVLLEKFFDFCAKFPYGRNHMWLREKWIGPEAPFIQDALRPGIDLGYHLQHRLPRKQLQAEAALAASALKDQGATVDTLIDLGPCKLKSAGGRNFLPLHQQWDNPDDLRMIKKTILKEKRPEEMSKLDSEMPSQFPVIASHNPTSGGGRPVRTRQKPPPPWRIELRKDTKDNLGNSSSEMDLKIGDVELSPSEVSE